jgi:hypothetical protein
VILFSDWRAAERTNLFRPKARRKSPATTEDLRFTYPNIGDSQQALMGRRRLKIAGPSEWPSVRYEPSLPTWLHAINLPKFAPIQQ